MSTVAIALLLALGRAKPGAAQGRLAGGTPRLLPSAPLLLVVDDDDNDDDGVTDKVQTAHVPPDNLVEVLVRESDRDVQVSVLGGLRVLRGGSPTALPMSLHPDELPSTLFLQAVHPSLPGHPLALVLTRGKDVERITVHAVELSLLDARNQPISPARDALSVSHRVTNDDSLPRSFDFGVESPDPDNVRVELQDVRAQGKRAAVRIEPSSLDDVRRVHKAVLSLTRTGIALPFRSRFLRLVGDEVDRTARGVATQVLQVALRDRVRVIYETPLGEVSQEYRVGRPGDETGPLAARQAVVHVVVLRTDEGGPPVIGVDELSALRIVRDELAIANDIWLQCHLTFGAPAETTVTIADPPGPTLLSIADGDGLPARGGRISLRVDGRDLAPVIIPTGASPQDTALRLAQTLVSEGFAPTVTVNPATVFGAGKSADVLIRSKSGAFVRIEPIEGVPLTSDLQQRLSIGRVDLGDGLEEFDNMTAQSGTLEERTLIKALSDDDPGSIDLFIVNRFTLGTRQGEAFIPATSGPIVSSVVLDRNGLRQRQTAWTMAHELGHVLLNQPLHPDNIGADVPMLLMDSDNNRGTVHGPKRLSQTECQRVLHESGKLADPPLIYSYDARTPESTAGAKNAQSSAPGARNASEHPVERVGKSPGRQ
jgi:hypothetical protein